MRNPAQVGEKRETGRSGQQSVITHLPRIAISIGDRRGIGPEITRAALADPSIASLATFVVHGAQPDGTHGQAGGLPHQTSHQLLFRVPHQMALTDAGRASYEAVRGAIDAVKRGEADAIVTAPISKEAWHAAGITSYPGHTELLAEAFESRRSGMLFVGPRLRVILATIHIPLKDVPKVLRTDDILEKIELGARACQELGIAKPRVAVAGLNPHAGEGGILGDEDARLIAPAIASARAQGIDASGPHPGDTVFSRALKGEFDLVVAMYHDQGLIPVKLIDGREAVNVTVGLSWKGRRVVRTSPAHGTALDIAGKSLTDATSMKAAIRLAAQMVRTAHPA